MKAALQILGHARVHHGYEMSAHPEQGDFWHAAWKAKIRGDPALLTPAFWNPLLGAYDAVTDMPAVCFAAELLQAYPEAKVIFTRRDEAAWFKSFNRGVIDTWWDSNVAMAIMAKLDPELMRPMYEMFSALLAQRDGYFRSATRSEMRDNAVETYRRHNETVLSSVSAERLLVRELGGGWGPLCEHLGLEVPSVPFPRINEGDAIREVLAEFMRRCMLRIVRNVSVVVVPVAFAAYWLLK